MSAGSRRTAGGYLAGLAIIAVALGVLHLLLADVRAGRIAWFDLDRERNLPTFFSGAVFFFLGCAAVTAFVREHRRNAEGEPLFRLPWLWLGVAVIGFAMSLDEMTILHENLFWREVRLTSARLGDAWVFLTQWQILFAPAVILVVGYLLVFLNNRYAASPPARRMALTGIGAWVMAFALEGVRNTARLEGGEGWYTLEVVLEELLEILGAIALLASITFYVLDIGGELPESRRTRLRNAARFLTRRTVTTLAIVFGFLALAGGTMYVLADRLVEQNAPIPSLQRRATRQPSRSVNPPPTLDPRTEIAAAIDAGVGWLVRACGTDGRFVYRINLDPAVTPAPRYNLLRHAGTIYALVEAQRRRPEAETLAAVTRAASFLKQAAIRNVPDESDLLAVWSPPGLTRSGEPMQAKLGGSGLALVALTDLESVERGHTDIEVLRGLARFILFMQKSDGSFSSKYIPSSGGRQDRWTSLYYPGEAALGLVMLYEHDPDPAWVRGAISALTYLARSRQDDTRVPADQWALLATARLLRIEDLTVDRDALVHHARQIVESILEEQLVGGPDAVREGGFARDGRTTPTATRLEGLLAALEIFTRAGSDDGDGALLRRRIETAVERGVGFLLRAQVRAGTHAGAMPRSIAPLPARGDSSVANFNRRSREVRIDYVQHAICAWMQYEDGGQ